MSFVLSLLYNESLSLTSKSFKVFYSSCDQSNASDYCYYLPEKESDRRVLEIPQYPDFISINETLWSPMTQNYSWNSKSKQIIVNGGYLNSVMVNISYPFSSNISDYSSCVLVDQAWNPAGGRYFTAIICDYEKTLSKEDIGLIVGGTAIFVVIITITLLFVYIKKRSKLSRLANKLRDQREPLITNEY
ncbi:hypothetical protein PPL_07686 [Heterostelium album PN500]|uniref:Uncharacterized protein n=1 Tax=Heterostelium pallidum (strain ATCC 26659 / Pp 5 / PN500) TaxID=670386 RepID=D3BGN4_HETP5|nr:hypothetical protein PPL_07686 [Heterostelium album PN500]EFA79268.1 hypothetical protein PPL_07686 [Heterostelium album PN500]|eukprot:XP_020431389.1 hypothetical protein PPL_07686 [Heterostelium album PN500]